MTSRQGYKALGQVATLQRGFDLPATERICGMVPVISSGGVCGYHNVAKVTGPGVITGRYGSVGSVFYVEEPFWPLNTTLYVKDFHGNEPKFVYYLLTRFNFAKFKDKTGVPGVNRNDLHKVPVYCPTLAEQRRAVSALDCFEATANTLEGLINAERTFKCGLVQQLLTGQKRFPEFKKRPWDEVHLGDVFDERTETNRPDLPLLSVTNDRGVVPRDELDKRDTSNPDKSKYKRVAVGDIAYNTMRMWQGVSALSELEGIVSPAYTVAIPTDRIQGSFAKHLFKFPPVVHLFHRRSQGLVDDTLNLKFDRFAKIKLSIPGDTSEQTRIANVLDLCDAEIELLKALRKQFEDYKRALLSRFLSGELANPASS